MRDKKILSAAVPPLLVPLGINSAPLPDVAQVRQDFTSLLHFTFMASLVIYPFILA